MTAAAPILEYRWRTGAFDPLLPLAGGSFPPTRFAILASLEPHLAGPDPKLSVASVRFAVRNSCSPHYFLQPAAQDRACRFPNKGSVCLL
jgi:hypothetical protein